MSLRVDDFKAKLKGGGARPNLFRAKVNFPAYAGGDVELTSFLCKAAQLPASIMNVIEVPFRGRQLKLAGDRTFEPWEITVLNDTDFTVRNSMERWMNGMNAHSENTGLTNPVDYEADLIVEQLDKDGSVVKTYTFRGCFPTTVAAIDLSYETVDTVEEFGVTMQVQYWESNTTS
ncbi:MAG: phage tail protein [Psychromonas sp.]